LTESPRSAISRQAKSGYFNPKPFREYTEFEKTVHFIDVALSDDPQFQTPVGFSMTALAYPAEKDNLLVLLSRVPKDLFPSGGKGPSEVATIVLDGKKNIVSFKRTTLDLAGIAQAESCHFTYSLLPPLLLRPGKVTAKGTATGLEAESFQKISIR
jgi:hypothetical protein